MFPLCLHPQPLRLLVLQPQPLRFLLHPNPFKLSLFLLDAPYHSLRSQAFFLFPFRNHSEALLLLNPHTVFLFGAFPLLPLSLLLSFVAFFASFFPLVLLVVRMAGRG